MMCPFCMREVQSEICPGCGKMISYAGDPMHLQVGYVLNGIHPYVLGASLGQGGFGITYIALDIESGCRVAIKEYFPTYCAGRSGSVTVASYRGQEETYVKGKEQFLNEARMLKSLSDLKSVVNVLDYFEANNSAYLVMEFLDGMSLKDYVEQKGKLPAQQFLQQMQPLMVDMEKMHQRGVVHRDIAPDNIILLPDGRLKLIDFGAARSYVGDKSMTVVVKKGFAPVEQYMRKGSNASTDVYALAATIYYCITGIVPPDSAERQYGETSLQAPTALGVELSREQERGLEKALEIQPKARTQSVAELEKALEQAPKPVKPKAEKPKAVPKPKQIKSAQAEPKKKAKWWIPVAAALVLCAGAGMLFMGKDAPDVSEPAIQLEATQIQPVETQPARVFTPEELAYNEAVDFFKNGEYGKAAIAFGKLGDFRDASEISKQIWDAIADRKTITEHAAVKEDGTVLTQDYDVEDWTDIVDLDQWGSLIGLKSDGTVIATDNELADWITAEKGWSDIVAIKRDWAYGFSGLFGLKSDGTVVVLNMYDAYGDKYNNRDTVQETTYLEALKKLSNITEILEPEFIRTTDGFYILEKNDNGMEFVRFEDQDIVDYDFGVRVNTDGTVLMENPGEFMAEKWLQNRSIWQEATKIYNEVSQWDSIVDVAYRGSNRMGLQSQLVGLKSDGTMVSAGQFPDKQNDFGDWTDIVSFVLGSDVTLGLRSDGTIVSCGTDEGIRQEAESWTNIRVPADKDALLSAIKLNYIT